MLNLFRITFISYLSEWRGSCYDGEILVISG